MEDKDNECFPTISDEALDKLATKYVPENTEQMTRWAATAFQEWRDVHNAQRTDVKCLNNLLVKYELGSLNKWLSTFVAEARHADGSPIPPQDISGALGRVAPTRSCDRRASTLSA